MMKITSNSRARNVGKKRREVKEEYGRILREEEGIVDYGELVQPSQQHA